MCCQKIHLLTQYCPAGQRLSAAYCPNTDAVDKGSRTAPPETYQEEGAPASDVREAHGDALVLSKAQAHVAALLADHSCHPKHGLGAALAQVCVTLMTCTAKHP